MSSRGRRKYAEDEENGAQPRTAYASFLQVDRIGPATIQKGTKGISSTRALHTSER